MAPKRVHFAHHRGHSLVWRLTGIAGTCAVAWLAGLLWFATGLPSSVAEPERVTDAIVVLTGGSGRVHRGLQLLAEKRAKKLFISGVYRGVDVQELLRISQRSPSDLECCIALGYEADSTRGNARETAIWMGVLEEKVSFYEREFPRLKEIHSTVCIGQSPPFLRVLRQIVPQSQMTIPTWISGESGVGKTALAHTIHMLSPRAEGPFHEFAAAEFAAADPLLVLGKLFGYGPGHGIRDTYVSTKKTVMTAVKIIAATYFPHMVVIG